MAGIELTRQLAEAESPPEPVPQHPGPQRSMIAFDASKLSIVDVDDAVPWDLEPLSASLLRHLMK